MTSPRVIIFTDSDLDGAGSYAYMSWLVGPVPKKTVTVKKFRSEILSWLETNKFSDYDRVFFLDLDVSDHIDLIDKPNVVVIDHHETHLPHVGEYKNAKVYVEKYSSCMRYLHGVVFKNKINLSDAQKRLVLLVDDYDSYKMQIPESLNLNLWFWAQQGSRIDKFMENFGYGFSGFSTIQENLIRQCRQEIKDCIDNVQAYAGKIDIGTKRCSVISLMVDKHPNEVAQHILNNDKPDVVIMVNLRNKSVYVRSACPEVDCALLAEEYLEGGGHPDAAGGVLTNEFMELTKGFTPFEIKR